MNSALNIAQPARLAHRKVACALDAVAGEFSDIIAGLAPFPHNTFFELPSCRMHLLGVLLSLGAVEDSLLTFFGTKKWREAAGLLSGHVVPGLEGNLSAIALPMWTPAQYRALWSLLVCAKARIVMQHQKQITPTLVDILAQLPPALRSTRIVRHVARPMEARVVAGVCGAGERIELLLRLVQRSDNREQFYDRLAEVARKAERFPPPPPIDHPLVTAIVDYSGLNSAAINFSNCLRQYRDQLVRGEIGFYVVAGEEPAVVSVRPRLGGHHIVEDIKGKGNQSPSLETEARILTIFGANGIDKCKETHVREIGEETFQVLGVASLNADEAIDRICASFIETVGLAKA